MRTYSILVLIFLLSCTGDKETIDNPKFIDYTLQSTFPHDQGAFTQGLVIDKGQLYESTGQENSWIGIVNVKTGVADKKIILDKKYFGEGITILNNKIYQLTWQNRKGFVYDLKTHQKIKEFDYPHEGWGITHDQHQLIMSDGTSTLYFIDTLSLNQTKTIEVTYEGKPVNALNELEFIDGFVFANIWRTNWIAKINPKTGVTEGFIDLTKLAQHALRINPNADVLNGIAWHDGTQTLLVTGKNWPNIYALKISTNPAEINQ